MKGIGGSGQYKKVKKERKGNELQKKLDSLMCEDDSESELDKSERVDTTAEMDTMESTETINNEKEIITIVNIIFLYNRSH